ncbi:MAG: hypothetical protein HYU02_00400 [Thaumarchaeota archaeon]|nr:hypothetical protein [Nitrososphaerota archaeon]
MLRNRVYEKIKSSGNIIDTELLEALKKDGVEITMRDLNKALFHLEILNMVSVRWMGKEKRRIEIATKEAEKPQAIW